jgi:membrane protein YqaA with SNARE-associated domain
MGLAAHRHAMWALAAVSFIESSFFPVPPDVLLVPMVLAARANAWRIALVCTVASVLGGMFGYGIGYFLYETVGRALLEFYGYADKFSVFQGYYRDWGAWIVLGAGVTPFPYKVITIASGVVGLDLFTFTGASVVARGLRFFVEAALLWYIGPPIKLFIERNLGMVASSFFFLLLGGFVIAAYIL